MRKLDTLFKECVAALRYAERLVRLLIGPYHRPEDTERRKEIQRCGNGNAQIDYIAASPWLTLGLSVVVFLVFVLFIAAAYDAGIRALLPLRGVLYWLCSLPFGGLWLLLFTNWYIGCCERYKHHKRANHGAPR